MFSSSSSTSRSPHRAPLAIAFHCHSIFYASLDTIHVSIFAEPRFRTSSTDLYELPAQPGNGSTGDEAEKLPAQPGNGSTGDEAEKLPASPDNENN